MKRKIEIFVPEEGFFALHSHSYGVIKRQILPAGRQVWGEKIILQPIIENLNEFLMDRTLKTPHLGVGRIKKSIKKT